MSLESLSQAFKEIAEAATLSVLAKHMPMESLTTLNEPIDMLKGFFGIEDEEETPLGEKKETEISGQPE